MTRSLVGCGFLDHEDIVKKYSDDTAPDKHVGLDLWRQLPPETQDAFIEQEVERNGIERPTGYKVSFHYNARVEAHHFGKMHPMKPWRLTLTKQLTLSYGLQYAMDLFESRMATKRELAEFHSEEYLTFLEGFVRVHQSENHSRLQPKSEIGNRQHDPLQLPRRRGDC
jgi:histone deacetylase HOS2